MVNLGQVSSEVYSPMYMFFFSSSLTFPPPPPPSSSPFKFCLSSLGVLKPSSASMR